MFQDLDATLRAMLGDAAAPGELRDADVSFDVPDKDFNPTRTTVDLFLFEIRENRALRDDAPLRDRVDGGYLLRPAPVRIACTYLATAWSPGAGAVRTDEEHRVLGALLPWLHAHPRIDDRFLRGGLQDPPQVYPLPAEVEPMREGMGQFWTALGIAPRPALPFTVTIGMRAFEQEDQFPAVQAIQAEGVLADRPVLAGRVLNSELAPVPAALVALVGTDREATADRAGRFSFPDVDFGAYVLSVRVADRPEVRASVSYGPDSQVHNVVLPAQ